LLCNVQSNKQLLRLINSQSKVEACNQSKKPFIVSILQSNRDYCCRTTNHNREITHTHTHTHTEWKQLFGSQCYAAFFL